jgi:hypothetical protein
MKSLLAVALFIFTASAAFGQDVYELWTATVSLPVLYSGTNVHHQPATLTQVLTTDDVINLALGRPLTTKIDTKTTALALAGDASTPGVGSSIIVVNPTTRTLLATVFNLPIFDVIFANPPADTNAVVYATANVVATSGTGSVLNGFDSSSPNLSIAGTGKLTGKLSVTSTAFCGPLNFHTTNAENVTTSYQGIVIKGSFHVSAGSLGTLQ